MPGSPTITPRKLLGLALAPTAFGIIWAIGLPLPWAAHKLLAIFIAIVILWVTEAIPIAATALLIAPLLVVTGVTDPKTAFAPYADPLLFLFVGGFMIARAMTRHQLDRRIAIGLVSLPAIGSVPWRVRAVFMVTALVMSMWISNTATAAILVPILIGMMPSEGNDENEGNVTTPAGRATTGAVLAMAYACSIGGLGTPVGSPPNLIAMRFLAGAGTEISFFQWVVLAMPAVIAILIAAFILMQWLFPPVAARNGTEAKSEGTAAPRLGPVSQGEIATAVAFGVAVIGWMVPGLLVTAGVPHAEVIDDALPAGAVAIFAASLLFLPVADNGERVLPWSDAARIDWGIIMLFGGGISLGTQMFETGLAEAMSNGFVAVSGVSDLWTLTALVTIFTIFFTETCSNTATSNMLAPLVIAVAKELEVSAAPPVLAVGLAASCAFMLPIATGPNAIAYGSGRVDQSSMIRAGFFLNLVSAVIIIAVLRVMCPLLGFG